MHVFLHGAAGSTVEDPESANISWRLVPETGDTNAF